MLTTNFLQINTVHIISRLFIATTPEETQDWDPARRSTAAFWERTAAQILAAPGEFQIPGVITGKRWRVLDDFIRYAIWPYQVSFKKFLRLIR